MHKQFAAFSLSSSLLPIKVRWRLIILSFVPQNMALYLNYYIIVKLLAYSTYKMTGHTVIGDDDINTQQKINSKMWYQYDSHFLLELPPSRRDYQYVIISSISKTKDFEQYIYNLIVRSGSLILLWIKPKSGLSFFLVFCFLSWLQLFCTSSDSSRLYDPVWPLRL